MHISVVTCGYDLFDLFALTPSRRLLTTNYYSVKVSQTAKVLAVLVLAVLVLALT